MEPSAIKPNPKFPEGQGYNDARGEVPDLEDTPKGNGLNLNNDPHHIQEKALSDKNAVTQTKPVAKKETPEAQGESEGMSSAGMACAKCGLPRGDWKENKGSGIVVDQVAYCCQSCADQTN